MGYTLLDINISKQIDFNHSRKVAWLRSDRRFPILDGVCASLPYYFIEGEVHSNIRKIAQRTKELGYDTLIFGERCEIQTKCTHGGSLVFDALAKENIDVILKIQFENPILEMLQNRKYLIDTTQKAALIALLRQLHIPALKGLYWQLTPIPPAQLQSPQFRQWTIKEILLEEINLLEKAFDQVPFLIAEASNESLSDTGSTNRTILSCSRYQGKPWEEYTQKMTSIQKPQEGYRRELIMNNRGMLMMGEGLWPLQKEFSCTPNPMSSHWGDCDLFNQFPSDNRLTIDWGTLGLEARLLWLKMLKANEKPTQRIQLDAWGYQLREMELRAEENPLIRHFIADAWYFLSSIQSQPVHQGIGQGGFWKGRPLIQDPQSDGSPWFTASRLFL